MRVAIEGDMQHAMLSFARERHPDEMILLLRGEAGRDEILIEELLFPPFGSAGRSFAEFRSHMLPIDFSIVGTAHSHPSGSARPSTTDLNHFYARVMLIIAYPYTDECVAAFNSRGEALPLRIMG